MSDKSTFTVTFQLVNVAGSGFCMFELFVVLCLVTYNIGTLTSHIEPEDVDLHSKAEATVSQVCRNLHDTESVPFVKQWLHLEKRTCCVRPRSTLGDRAFPVAASRA